ncbi:MAG: hypothetical protein SGI90_16360 [Candidatus Eisenbacteria bacterium]|nr:hypothetical protein [Candidatus Eisenbacteria bacterium]
MWFRTALVLVLILLAWRILRGVVARLASTSESRKVAPDLGRKAPDSRGGGPISSQPGAAWPSGEVTDVTFREAHPDESSTR